MKNWKIITLVGIAVVMAALLTTSVFAMGMMGGQQRWLWRNDVWKATELAMDTTVHRIQPEQVTYQLYQTSTISLFTPSCLEAE